MGIIAIAIELVTLEMFVESFFGRSGSCWWTNILQCSFLVLGYCLLPVPRWMRDKFSATR